MWGTIDAFADDLWDVFVGRAKRAIENWTRENTLGVLETLWIAVKFGVPGSAMAYLGWMLEPGSGFLGLVGVLLVMGGIVLLYLPVGWLLLALYYVVAGVIVVVLVILFKLIKRFLLVAGILSPEAFADA